MLTKLMPPLPVSTSLIYLVLFFLLKKNVPNFVLLFSSKQLKKPSLKLPDGKILKQI